MKSLEKMTRAELREHIDQIRRFSDHWKQQCHTREQERNEARTLLAEYESGDKAELDKLTAEVKSLKKERDSLRSIAAGRTDEVNANEAKHERRIAALRSEHEIQCAKLEARAENHIEMGKYIAAKAINKDMIEALKEA